MDQFVMVAVLIKMGIVSVGMCINHGTDPVRSERLHVYLLVLVLVLETSWINSGYILMDTSLESAFEDLTQ